METRECLDRAASLVDVGADDLVAGAVASEVLHEDRVVDRLGGVLGEVGVRHLWLERLTQTDIEVDLALVEPELGRDLAALSEPR